MARLRKFDPDVVTARALDLFLREGFEGGSLADLERETGVGRKGLYNTFGSKRGLFIEALRHYEDLIAIPLIIEPLETEGAGRAEIVHLFGLLASPEGHLKENRGCLFCQTAKSDVAQSKDIGPQVQRYFERLRNAFIHALRGAKAAGDLGPHKDPDALADFLVGTVMGLSAMARAKRPKEQISHYVAVAMAALD
jgi:TetR/AcrR family transcriptional regulator, transcriptional repressor for nem operon